MFSAENIGELIESLGLDVDAFMDKGQIVERGSIEEIYTKPITDVTKKLLRDAGIREVSE